MNLCGEDVHLMGVYLMGVHPTRRAPHGCVSHGACASWMYLTRYIPHWCVPHGACISLGLPSALALLFPLLLVLPYPDALRTLQTLQVSLTHRVIRRWHILIL